MERGARIYEVKLILPNKLHKDVNTGKDKYSSY